MPLPCSKTALGILDCGNPMLAAHQFMGMLNELSLWPWMMGRKGLPVSAEDAVEETIRMFLQHYRRPKSNAHGDPESSSQGRQR
jgi:TetR/AcrR family transcriptional regulator of autoinduction and epiphytic fitness